ncbi:hypothetical protein AAC387_Pa03g3746 [Persea americana]
MGVDYYNILKVSRSATDEDLKRAYKRLAMVWHPDKNPRNKKEAEARFKQICEAYDVLSDPQKRQIYDQFGEEALKSGVSQPQPNGFWFNSRNPDDIFNEFFGGGGGSSPCPPGESFYRADGPPRKAAPVENKLPCSLEELYSGSKRKMRISRNVLDPSGKAKNVEEILTIDIKPGWKKGTKITFPEKGHEQPNIIPSDLIFVIEEKPHGIYRRDGNDLVVNRRISLVDSLAGGLLRRDGRKLPTFTTSC